MASQSEAEAIASSHAPRVQQDGAYKIRTIARRLIDPWNLTVEDITLDVLASGLSCETRYAGQLECGFYSVAQHSVLVAQYFDEPVLQLAGMLHDGEEGIGFKDIPSPIKARPEYAEVRKAMSAARRVIFSAFGIGDRYDELYPKVKVIDDIVYHRERRSFDGLTVKNRIVPLSPSASKQLYVSYFKRIQERLKT